MKETVSSGVELLVGYSELRRENREIITRVDKLIEEVETLNNDNEKLKEEAEVLKDENESLKKIQVI